MINFLCLYFFLTEAFCVCCSNLQIITDVENGYNGAWRRDFLLNMNRTPKRSSSSTGKKVLTRLLI